MSEQKTIIIAGIKKSEELSADFRKELTDKYGDDLIILSASEANEQGVLAGNVPSIGQYKFEASPRFKMPEIFFDKHQAKNDCKKGWRK